MIIKSKEKKKNKNKILRKLKTESLEDNVKRNKDDVDDYQGDETTP